MPVRAAYTRARVCVSSAPVSLGLCVESVRRCFCCQLSVLFCQSRDGAYVPCRQPVASCLSPSFSGLVLVRSLWFAASFKRRVQGVRPVIKQLSYCPGHHLCWPQHQTWPQIQLFSGLVFGLQELCVCVCTPSCTISHLPLCANSMRVSE